MFTGTQCCMMDAAAAAIPRISAPITLTLAAADAEFDAHGEVTVA